MNNFTQYSLIVENDTVLCVCECVRARARVDNVNLRRSPAYLFEVVFVKCVRIRRTSVFFQFYGVLSGVIYNYSSQLFLLLFKVTFL